MKCGRLEPSILQRPHNIYGITMILRLGVFFNQDIIQFRSCSYPSIGTLKENVISFLQMSRFLKLLWIRQKHQSSKASYSSIASWMHSHNLFSEQIKHKIDLHNPTYFSTFDAKNCHSNMSTSLTYPRECLKEREQNINNLRTNSRLNRKL